jgi:predicted Zn-dependent protease
VPGRFAHPEISMIRSLGLLLALAALVGCDGGDGTPREVREGVPVSPTVEAALTQCYGEVPAIPAGATGVSGSLFDRAKRMARDGTGRFVEAPSDEELAAIGDETRNQMRAQFPTSANAAGKARVDGIVKRLVAALPASSSDTYTFELLASDQINAFMSTGGRGVVLEALLPAMPDDDQLAFVLGHELAHGELMHGMEKVRNAKLGLELGTRMERWLESERAPEVMAMLTGKVLGAVYDQDQEFEADRLGLCLMWRAGFDPAGAAAAIRTLGGAEQAAPRDGVRRIAYDIRASHPAGAERIAYLERLAGLIRSVHGE